MDPVEYARTERWCITGQPPPPWIADRIHAHYVRPLLRLHDEGGPLFDVSNHSCYRPKAYELSKRRSGTSYHTFPRVTLGACDLLVPHGLDCFQAGELLVKRMAFRRVCVYPNNGFIHVDYGQHQVPGERGKAQRYICKSPTSPWVRVPTFPA